MFRLILRQMARYRWALLLLAVIWTVAGVWFYRNRYSMVSYISALTTDFPEPGTQESSHAYFQFVEPALQDIADAGVRLDLMKRACPVQSRRPFFSVELARNHWLEKMRHWNVAPAEEAPNIVDPAGYWQQNRQIVLDALQKLIQATYYAYEISGEDRGVPGKEMILLPSLIDEYSSALCMPLLGRLSWGDYIQFQERRAYRNLQQEAGDSEDYLLPAEKDLLTLGSLRNSRNYQEALAQYMGGGPPSPFSPEGCNNGSLVCLAPREAFDIYNRLLFSAPEERLPHLFLEQGRVMGWLARKNDNSLGDPYPRALDLISGAASSPALQREARTDMTQIYLIQRDYENARAELRQLSLITNMEGADAADLRDLARKALTGLGQAREADCFAESYGVRRPHCRELRDLLK